MRTPDQQARFKYWLQELTAAQYMATLASLGNDTEAWNKHLKERDEAREALIQMYENAGFEGE